MALAPCGTIAAYTRHRRNNETPCDPCRLAKNAYNREYRAKPKRPKPERMIFPPCKGCGRDRRPSKASAKDYPGTALSATKDLCKGCYAREQRRKKGIKSRRRATNNCLNCGIELYTKTDKHTQPPTPDAVPHAARGLCNGCYKYGKPSKPKKPAPTECRQCEHPLRASKRKLADYPGTLQHAGKGLCTRCYYHRTEAPTPALEPTVDPALEAFNRKRRDRLAAQQRAAQHRKRVA